MKDLSERKYKAFISYRHRPLDMRVAKRIQRSIERYVIPADLRENGEKRLGYVFRDQSELIASSDLSDVIHNALDNSEYLIVVCTPDAAKSEWVNEEISYFLTNHDRDHVLAVLASGEPEEAFPPAMTNEILEDGTVRYTEPLAANIAADSTFNRALIFRNEILRIIAALIGCRYDTLFRRDHRYTVIRRMAVIFAVLLIALFDIGLLINRNVKIRSNYEESLRNQSIYFAAESQRLLESGDRFSAIRLAMEALPSDKNNRPLVSQAMLALSNAENIYTAPSDEKVTGATGVLSHNAPVDKYTTDSKGTLLCSKTDENTLTMWSLSSMKPMWRMQLENSVSSGPLKILDDGSVCVLSGSELISMNSISGDVIWSQDLEKLLPDLDSFFLHQILIPEDKDEVILGLYDTYYVVSLKDGSLVCGFPFPPVSFRTGVAKMFFPTLSVSSDGNTLAATFNHLDDPEWNYVITLETYSGRVLNVSPVFPKDSSYPLVYPIPELGVYATAYITAGDYTGPVVSGTDVLSYNTMTVCGFSLSSGEKLWEFSDRYVIPSLTNEFIPMESEDGDSLIAHIYSNRIDLIDPLTGEKTGSAESASAIAGAEADGGTVTAVTESGDRVIMDSSTPDYWLSSRLFISGLKSADFSRSRIFVQKDDSEDIICYSSVSSDPLWAEYSVNLLSDQEEEMYMLDHMISDGIAAFLYLNRHGRFSIILGDGSGTSALREVILPEKLYEEELRSCYMEDFYGGKLILSWSTDSIWGFMEINASTLKISTSYPQIYHQTVLSRYMGKGRFCAVYTEDMPGYDEEKYHLVVLNTSSETVYTTFLGRYPAGSEIFCTFDPQGMIYAVIPAARSVKKIDPVIGTRLDVPLGINDILLDLAADALDPGTCSVWSDDMSFSAFRVSDTRIKVTDADGNILFSVNEDVLRIIFFTFTPDSKYLLVLGSDDYLRRYDVRTGELLGSLKLQPPADTYPDTYRYTLNPGKGFMTVSVGSTLNLISLTDWEIFGYVQDCAGYQSTHDLFICYKHDEKISYGYFPRYTVQMLLEHARELLSGWDMSNDQLSFFGITHES